MPLSMQALAGQSLGKSDFLRGEFGYFSRMTEKWRRAQQALTREMSALRRMLGEAHAWSERDLRAFGEDLGKARAALNVVCKEKAKSAQATEAAETEVVTLRETVATLWNEAAQSAQTVAKLAEVAEAATKSAETAEGAMAALQTERDDSLRRVEAAEAAVVALRTECDQALERARAAESALTAAQTEREEALG
jgi:chromosome segregation ATPase